MPQQVAVAVENNFTKGVITESTGLNFPENAATDADNCEFTLIGDVNRRLGVNYETNGSFNNVGRANKAISTYKWNNAGGDGLTEVVVEQVGSILYFYRSTDATISTPLSGTKLASTVDVSTFVAVGGTFDPTVECQFTQGNGYLFIFHPNCDPAYCTYAAGTITASIISIQIRDFVGIPDSLAVTARPNVLSNEHNYNLNNQGWTSGNAWLATSTDTKSGNFAGSTSFTVASGLSITGGDTCNIYGLDSRLPGIGIATNTVVGSGTVSSYVGTTLTITIVFAYGGIFSTGTWTGWNILQTNLGHITLWHTDIGNYPSNADVWWYFKDEHNIFNPTAQVASVPLSSANAPQGHFIMNAFNQQRSLLSGVPGLTDIKTTVRPRTGGWFQGRVWYTGVDAQQAAVGDEPYTTWTENIYFSQIVKTPDDFGACHQDNDPTSETLFDILPTDGGVITIPGCGSIFKLFSLQNAMLVFAANGVWYLTGSSGIGFAANDYTIVKLSSVKSISSTSFIDVQGLPIFWNEEGIYKVQPTKQGTGLLSSPLHVNPLEVTPITLGTILTLYSKIPLSSKKYARGSYHPVDYIVQWIYKDTEATSVTDRYSYNKILNYNDSNNAFFPYTVDNTVNSINSIIFVTAPGGSTSPLSTIKYMASNSTQISFADINDSAYVDWGSVNYISYFITGYKLRGQAIRKFQPQYIQVYLRTNGAASAYKIQGIWDYANDRSSGRWSTIQLVTNALTKYDTIYRRHKIRGHGFALQFKIQSADGQPFDIQGWAGVDTVNTGT